MKTWIFDASVVALLALSGAAQADEKTDICSLATLYGDYGFTITGQILGGLAPGPVNGVALTTFDGRGGLTQTDFVVKSGVPAGR